jgi:ATP-dependent RNA helicase RhlE
MSTISSDHVSGALNASTGFSGFGLIEPLLDALARLGHQEPTPIQKKAIEPALAGRDILGCAQTGTGKTAAFTLPLLQRLCCEEPRHSVAAAPGKRVTCAPIRALVLSPTRELAAQIDESLGLYGEYCDIRHTMICGGVGMQSQVRELRRGVDVLVATPGRLEDLMNQGLVNLSSVEILVLDEVDRMLDQGFLPAVRRITSKLPKPRQTLLFSATLPSELRKLALVLLSNPVEVTAEQVASTPDSIEQIVYHVDPQRKRQMVEHLLRGHDMARALVFTRTKHGADRVARHLRTASIGADALHGGKSQASRERTLAAFRDGTLKVLVATDLASRGIHVDGISHVINFDLPVDADSYVHRIGRTARAGASGKALSLCTAEERDTLRRIERLIQRRLPVQEAPQFAPAAPSSVAAPQRRGEGNPGRNPPGSRNGAQSRNEGATRGRPSTVRDSNRGRAQNSFRAN